MATVSKVMIANLALGKIGNNNPIESFDEASAQAKACKRWYEACRLQALEAFDWSFARKRLTLATHGDEADEDEWAYRYQYPADCVVARYIVNPLGKEADPVPYDIEVSANGTKSIVTNMEDAVLVFTFDQETVTMFSWHFIDTLSALLGWRIAPALNGSSEIIQARLNEYRALLVAAPAQNANEQMKAAPREAPWIRGR